jgi:hypothetical protein
MSDSEIYIKGFSNVDLDKMAKISVLTIHGQIVNEQNIILKNELEFTAQVTPGMYIVNIISENNKYRGLLIKY